MPDTDLGFMIEFSDTQSIKLLALETGQRYVLINSSIGSPFSIPQGFFLKSGGGYELHFCTTVRERGKVMQTWYNWFFGSDISNTLVKHKYLPLGHDINSLTETIHKQKLMEK